MPSLETPVLTVDANTIHRIDTRNVSTRSLRYPHWTLTDNLFCRLKTSLVYGPCSPGARAQSRRDVAWRTSAGGYGIGRPSAALQVRRTPLHPPSRYRNGAQRVATLPTSQTCPAASTRSTRRPLNPITRRAHPLQHRLRSRGPAFGDKTPVATGAEARSATSPPTTSRRWSSLSRRRRTSSH